MNLFKSALLIAISLGFLASCSQTAQPTTESEPLKKPGWFEQWFTMKKNEHGIIPQGLYTQWHREETNKAYKRKLSTGLINVQEIGPNNIGGRTMDILVDMANPNRIFAAAHSGGLWVSKTTGSKWQPINDWASNLTITALAQNPFQHQEIYYATGVASGGIGVPGEGLFKSTDGGNTFEQIDTSLVFGNIWDIEHSATDSHTLYVATSTKGLWRTQDGCKTFEKVLSVANVNDIELFPDGSVLVACVSVGIFRSETGNAETFTKITAGTPNSFNRFEMAKCDSFPNVVYANFTLNIDFENGRSIGVWKSSNSGKTWRYVENPSTGTGASFAQPWFTLAIGVDPLDSNKVLTGCRDFVFSKDGGKTWTLANNGHADHHVYTFRRDRPGYFFLGCDGGIYEYNWQTIATKYIDKNNGYNVTQFYAGSFMPDSLGNIAGSQDNGTTYSIDGRAKYNPTLGGDGAFCHIHQSIPTIAYMSYQNGAIRKTNRVDYDVPLTVSATNELDANGDGVIDDGAWFINPFEMNYLNSEMLFFPTRTRLWFSFDGAGSWYPLTKQGNDLYAVGIPNSKEPNKVYYGADNLWLYRIDNLYDAEPGDEVSLRKGIPGSLTGGFIANITVHPRNDGIVYLSLSNYSSQGRVWKVINADTDNPTWVNISGDLPKQLPANWVVVDPYQPDSFVIIGTDFGLYTSKNGGKNWVKEERIPNVVVQNLRLRYTDRKLFIFTHGRGTFVADLEKMEDPFMSVNENVSQKLKFYPNPANNYINLDLQDAFTYQIFDLSGKMVLEGNGAKQIDISQLSKGSYNLVATAKQRKYTAHFVKN